MKKSSESAEMITIPKSLFIILLRDQRRIHALEGAGVDNWAGYEYAMEEMDAITESDAT